MKSLLLSVLALILGYQKRKKDDDIGDLENEAYRMGVEGGLNVRDPEVQSTLKAVLTNALAQPPETATAGTAPEFPAPPPPTPAPAPAPAVAAPAAPAEPAPGSEEKPPGENPPVPPTKLEGYGIPLTGKGYFLKGRYIPTQEEVVAGGFSADEADNIVAREQLLAEDPNADVGDPIKPKA